MLKLSLDPIGYIHKPQGKEAAQISKTIAKHIVEISPKHFKAYLEAGHTWSAVFANNIRSADNWLGQQLYAADCDNGSLTISKAKEICELHLLEPFIIHESFSSTADKPKLRIIFKTDELITDAGLALGIQRKLAKIFGGDPAVCDIARLYYATNKPIAYFDKDAVLDLAELGQLPDFSTSTKLASSAKALEQIGKDYEVDQKLIFEILAEQNLGRFKLIITRLEEAKDCIQTIGSGSGYQSVLHATRRLAQLKELIEPYIRAFVTDCVSQCDDYAHGIWQHRNKLDSIIDAGIRLGRKRLYE